MPAKCQPAHAFVLRSRKDVDPVWFIEPPAAWYQLAALECGEPDPSRLASTVFFELPDCTVARQYMEFAKLAAEAQGDTDADREASDIIVNCALTNYQDFEEGRYAGAAMEALSFLRDKGYPMHCIRIAHLR